MYIWKLYLNITLVLMLYLFGSHFWVAPTEILFYGFLGLRGPHLRRYREKYFPRKECRGPLRFDTVYAPCSGHAGCIWHVIYFPLDMPYGVFLDSRHAVIFWTRYCSLVWLFGLRLSRGDLPGPIRLKTSFSVLIWCFCRVLQPRRLTLDVCLPQSYTYWTVIQCFSYLLGVSHVLVVVIVCLTPIPYLRRYGRATWGLSLALS